MSTKAKDILGKIKALFAAQESPQSFTEYKLSDGTALSIDKMVVGGAATKDGAPAPAGDYEFEDKSKITVDAAGLITVVTPAPVAADDMSTPEGMRKAYDRFATGTAEERLANLEVLCKALMEYSFGWQLREAAAKQTTDAAIAVYKNLTDSTGKVVEQQAKMMKEMFELMTEIVGAPTDEPPATRKKFSFADTEGRKKSFGKFQAAAKQLNEQWKELEKAS